MKKGIIYCATSPIGKKYYGQTTRGLKHRKNRHIRDAKNGCNFRFHQALRKYDFDFDWNIMEEISIDLLDAREKHYIKKDNTFLFENGYNMTLGGDTTYNISWGSHTEESKNKIRNSLLGIKHTKERRANESKSHMGKFNGDKNPCYIKIPEEIQKKIIDLHVNHRWGSRKLEKKFGYTYSKILRFLRKEKAYKPIYESQKSI